MSVYVSMSVCKCVCVRARTRAHAHTGFQTLSFSCFLSYVSIPFPTRKKKIVGRKVTEFHILVK